MNDLRDLYQEVILDHYKRPRNHAAPAGATLYANGHNPLCGDKLTVYVQLDGEKIKEVGFTGGGCAIATASASLMTESMQGKSKAEAEEWFHKFLDLVMKENASAEGLGKMAVLAGVREFPARVKCATLAWHTLHNALANPAQTAKTE